MNLSLVNRIFVLIGMSFLLSACSMMRSVEQDSAPTKPINWAQVKPVVPKKEVKSRYGNPETYEVFGKTYRVLESSRNFKQHGVASWYGTKFHGRRTSSGETYDMLQLTAAHKTLPIPCYVKVTNKDNGKELIVKVNDRGPFAKSRIIDLSYAAAHKLGMTNKGTANVVIETIDFDDNHEIVSNQRPQTSPSIIKPSKGKHRFVQVGAYSNQESAQKLAKVLDREIKLPVKISSVKKNGKNLFRVRIGPIHTLELAQNLAETLNINELGKPSIVYQN